MKDFSAFLVMGRYKTWALKIKLSDYLRVCFPAPCPSRPPPTPAQSTSCLLHPELLSAGIEDQQLQQHDLIVVDDRCQFVIVRFEGK